MRSTDLMTGLGRASTVLGRKHGTRVVFQGDEAKTDGKTIYLPALPINVELTDSQVKCARGFADHESGHVRHTDFRSLLARTKQGDWSKDKHTLSNCLEDVRLERLVQAEYIGSKENLDELNSVCNDEILASLKEKTPLGDLSDPTKCGPYAILSQDSIARGHRSAEDVLEYYSDDLKKKSEDWYKAIDYCNSTSDVIRLTDKIWEQLEEDNPPPIEPEEVQGEDLVPSDVDEEGEEGEGEGSGVAKEGEAQEAASKELKQAGHGPTDGYCGREELADGAPEDVLKNKDMYSDDDVVRPWTTEYDTWSDRKNHLPYWDEAFSLDNTKYEERKANLSTTTTILRNKITRFLKAKEKRDFVGGYKSGKLNTRTLVHAYNGAPNVFCQREETDEIDTAISILVDLSGSMNGSKARCAADCLVALAEAMEPTQFKYTINGFCTDVNDKATRPDDWRRKSGKWRMDSLDMVRFKGWDDRLHEAKSALGNIPEFIGGANNDPESILWAGLDVMKRREKRKVLIVLSDGEPAFSMSGFSGYHSQETKANQLTKEAVQYLESQGVQTIGIGINSSAVESFYKDYFVVSSPSDLADRALDKILQMV